MSVSLLLSTAELCFPRCISVFFITSPRFQISDFPSFSAGVRLFSNVLEAQSHAHTQSQEKLDSRAQTDQPASTTLQTGARLFYRFMWARKTGRAQQT